MRQPYIPVAFSNDIAPANSFQYWIGSFAEPGFLGLDASGGAVTEARVFVDNARIATYLAFATPQSIPELPRGRILRVESVGPAGGTLVVRLSGVAYETHKRVVNYVP